MQSTTKLPLSLIALWGLSSTLVCGQPFQSAGAKAQSDLENALTELSEMRDLISNEKVPMIRKILALEDIVTEKSNKLSRLSRLRDNSDLQLNQLREQVKAIEAQNEYVTDLLDQFINSFNARIDYSELQLYSEAIEEARFSSEDINLSQNERFERQIKVIKVALDRLEKLTGGYTFEGRALAPSGEIEEGTYVAFGPTVYFASKQSDLAGVTFVKLNSSEAAIAVPEESFSGNIREFIETGKGDIPIDPTLGKALKIEAVKDTFGEHIAHGGVIGYFIIALGVFCGLISCFKVVEIFRFKTPSPDQVQEVLQQIESGDTSQARDLATRIRGFGGQLLLKGIENINETRSTLEDVLYERILSVRPRIERFLPFIALTAAAGPLLGLLGTVTGMINTFKLITVFGTGDAGNLASGISQALVTTELGLIIAIPSLIIHGFLNRMARQKVGDLEQIAFSFINGIVGTHDSDSD